VNYLRSLALMSEPYSLVARQAARRNELALGMPYGLQGCAASEC
jgi:hypothetical protein